MFELILLFGICMFTMLQQSNMVSMLFHLTFFALLLGLLVQLVDKPWLNELHVLAVLVIILSFFHVSAQADTWTLNYFNKLIIFSCSILMIPYVTAIEVNRRHVDWILGMNLCIAALYPIMYICLPNLGYLGQLLTFHFSNPNLTAIFLLHSVLYCSVALYHFKSRMFRLLILILALVLIRFIYLTKARSCLVSLAFFAAFVVLNLVLKKDVRISKYLSLLLLSSPLIFALGYLALAESGLLEKFFSFLQFGEGKPLTSRVNIWMAALADFAGNPLFGAYDVISEGSGMSQMHNTHIDILVSYGVLPFMLFISLLHKGVQKVLPLATAGFSRMGLFAFYTVIIMGTFEAALVSGSVGLYIMSFGFLLLAKYQGDVTE